MVTKGFRGILFGFAAGLIAAGVFFSSPVWAQFGMGSSRGYDEDAMRTKVPADYGKLVAINGVNFYFQGDGGNIYILKQRTQNEFDSKVTVIERGE